MSAVRSDVVARVAAAVVALPRPPRRRVAIDGVDGAGKTWFADELGAALGALGVPVVRAGVDGFHHPRAVRYRRGRDSPLGYVDDSYDLAALQRELPDPFGPGGDGVHRTAGFDHRVDRPVTVARRAAAADAVLVVDGIFLHGGELRSCWDLSVFLDVPFAVTFARMAHRDGSDPDPGAPENRRYLEGQRHYLAAARPAEVATFVVDDADLTRPVVLERPSR